MQIKDLINQLRRLQRKEPDAEVYIEGPEWCDKLAEPRLAYFGSWPVVLLKDTREAK